MRIGHFLRLTMCALAMLMALPAAAQRRNARYVAYINEYKNMAIDQMERYRIPASITLAQGLLESGAGMSQLARKSNNHFGIKCGGHWKGRTVRHDDDRRNECFRAYRNAKESYEDHSKFLASGSRYAFLFRLDITDYKGWAKGLKKAGYATDRSYANRLITIIEDYELYQYDTKRKKHRSRKEEEKKKQSAKTESHAVYRANNIAYVKARKGDTFRSIAKEFKLREKSLIKYNDLHNTYVLQPGDVLYLKSKNQRASKEYEVHVVKEGESMHSISQMYGIQMKYLYKMNRKGADYAPEVGDRLRLR